jgi:hypothetical protein
MTDLLLLSRIEETLAREGYPVCHEVGRATRYYVKQFLREGKAGDLAWESFRETRGFCAAHTALLHEIDTGGSVEGLSTATLYGWPLADRLRAAGIDEDEAAGLATSVPRPRANGFPASPLPGDAGLRRGTGHLRALARSPDALGPPPHTGARGLSTQLPARA